MNRSEAHLTFMTYEINETHDPNLRSWVESANDPETDFPIQNLPFCVFYHERMPIWRQDGVLIGDLILDLHGAKESGLLEEIGSEARYLIGDGLTLEAYFGHANGEQRAVLRRCISKLFSD